MKYLYADIIIPVALEGLFTYSIPESMRKALHRGSLVTVPFGRGSDSTGLVVRIHDSAPEGVTLKEITGLLPGEDSVNDRLTDFLLWMADYYMAYPGEVMKAAIPAAEYLPGRPMKRRRREKEREEDESHPPAAPADLNEVQNEAYERIRELFAARETVLLHGVTSSGKTEIYIHLMTEQMKSGRQVL